MTLALERGGWPVLHAAGVEVEAGAVLFLALAGTGKSTLAATCASLGHRVLGDDLIPVGMSDGAFVARPSYPRIALWPGSPTAPLSAQTAQAPPVAAGLEKRAVSLMPAQYCHEPRTIRCICVLDRAAGPSESAFARRRLPPREALMALVCHSFSPRSVEAAGLQPRRLAFFGALAQSVPIIEVRYRSGFDELLNLCRGIGRLDEAADVSFASELYQESAR